MWCHIHRRYFSLTIPRLARRAEGPNLRVLPRLTERLREQSFSSIDTRRQRDEAVEDVLVGNSVEKAALEIFRPKELGCEMMVCWAEGLIVWLTGNA